jgi:hypothetical protein
MAASDRHRGRWGYRGHWGDCGPFLNPQLDIDKNCRIILVGHLVSPHHTHLGIAQLLSQGSGKVTQKLPMVLCGLCGRGDLHPGRS